MQMATSIWRPPILRRQNRVESWEVLKVCRSPFSCNLQARPILLFLALIILVPVSSAFAIVPSESDEKPTVLVPHQPIVFHVNSGGSVALAFGGQVGKLAEILIEASAAGAEFVVLTPDRRALETISAEKPGWLAASFLLAQAGQYRLMARAKAVENGVGGISCRAEFMVFSSVSAESHNRAANLMAEAQSLSQPLESDTLHAAIAQYRRAGVVWAAAGDREGQVLALTGEAKAWLDLSIYSEALAALNRAGYLSLQMPLFRVYVANLEAQVYLDRWDSVAAKRYANEAVRRSSNLRDKWLMADALAVRAEAEWLTDDKADLEDSEAALRLSRESQAADTLARALRCKSWMEQDKGHLTRAMALMRESEEQFRNAGEMRDALEAVANLANVQGMDGDPYAAVVQQSSLLPLMQRAGMRTDRAFLLLNIADGYGGLNRNLDAIAYYNQSIEAFHEVGILSGEQIGLSQLCGVLVRAGQLQEANRDCPRAKAMAEQLHDPTRLAITMWRIGKFQRACGYTDRAIASFRQAYTISKSVLDARTEAEVSMDWGDTLEGLGKREEARAHFEDALPLSQSAEGALRQIEARFRIARSEFETRQDEAAKRELKDALDSIASLRQAVGNSDLQASYFAQVHKCHDLYVEILMDEYARAPSPDAAAQALGASEAGRALTLLDALSTRTGIRTAGLKAGTPQQLMELHLAVERAYDQRLKLMLEGDQKTDLAANGASLTQAIDALERAEDERKTAVDTSAQRSRTLSGLEIAEASKKLDNTLVEFALGTEHSYVWVIENGKIESHVLPARNTIESAVKEWRELAKARISRPGEGVEDHAKRVESADRELARVGAQLSCILLGPFLRPGMDRLTIVPDGELDMLPFAALPENGCQGGREPLASKRQTVFAPSLTIFLMPRDSARQEFSRGDVALFADPVFDRDDPRVNRTVEAPSGAKLVSFMPALPRLWGTRREAEAIADIAGPEHTALYLDFNASLETLLNAPLSEYRILHLATHGVADEDRPDFSGIVLSLVGSDGRPIFGYLKTHDIAQLELRSELVVLSSCDTAAGVNLSGEGVTGINHAFLSAGARRVISTLWSVDDKISDKLMIAFYRDMLREGLEPSEALRRSQIEIMLNSRTAAPYYWAAFNITSTVN